MSENSRTCSESSDSTSTGSPATNSNSAIRVASNQSNSAIEMQRKARPKAKQV
jgi:hypothetical protein